MTWEVRPSAGGWESVAPSGQVFGVFACEVEARDAPDVLALVRGRQSVTGPGVLDLGNEDVTRLRAEGDTRPAPHGAERCTDCGFLMRRQTDLPTPGWRVRSAVGMCATCVARMNRQPPAETDAVPDHPVLVVLARERAARAERKARVEHARLADYARRLAVKRRTA